VFISTKSATGQATNGFKEAGIIEGIEEADLEQEDPFADLDQAQDHDSPLKEIVHFKEKNKLHLVIQKL